MIRPEDYQSVLHDCYLSLLEHDIKSVPRRTVVAPVNNRINLSLLGPDPWFLALLSLMADGYDEAWRDFETHLGQSTIPPQFNFERLKSLVHA